MLCAMAKTRGTGKIEQLSDGHLDHMISSQCLDVYEASVMFSKPEWDFAVDTLLRLLDERRSRAVQSST